MSDAPSTQKPKETPSLAGEVGVRAERKLRAQRRRTPGIWFGLGMMGLIGWSVVVPTLLGTAVGLWLDRTHPGEHGWTLALLAAGLSIGCWNAWQWVVREDKAMRDDEGDETDA